MSLPRSSQNTDVPGARRRGESSIPAKKSSRPSSRSSSALPQDQSRQAPTDEDLPTPILAPQLIAQEQPREDQPSAAAAPRRASASFDDSVSLRELQQQLRTARALNNNLQEENERLHARLRFAESGHPDYSKDIEQLKAQIAELQKENNELRSQLEETRRTPIQPRAQTPPPEMTPRPRRSSAPFSPADIQPFTQHIPPSALTRTAPSPTSAHRSAAPASPAPVIVITQTPPVPRPDSGRSPSRRNSTQTRDVRELLCDAVGDSEAAGTSLLGFVKSEIGQRQIRMPLPFTPYPQYSPRNSLDDTHDNSYSEGFDPFLFLAESSSDDNSFLNELDDLSDFYSSEHADPRFERACPATLAELAGRPVEYLFQLFDSNPGILENTEYITQILFTRGSTPILAFRHGGGRGFLAGRQREGMRRTNFIVRAFERLLSETDRELAEYRSSLPDLLRDDHVSRVIGPINDQCEVCPGNIPQIPLKQLITIRISAIIQTSLIIFVDVSRLNRLVLHFLQCQENKEACDIIVSELQREYRDFFGLHIEDYVELLALDQSDIPFSF